MKYGIGAAIAFAVIGGVAAYVFTRESEPSEGVVPAGEATEEPTVTEEGEV